MVLSYLTLTYYLNCWRKFTSTLEAHYVVKQILTKIVVFVLSLYDIINFDSHFTNNFSFECIHMPQMSEKDKYWQTNKLEMSCCIKTF